MAIELKNTREVSRDGVKILVYGDAGSGKTWLIRTLAEHGLRPIILSAEAGLLSLADIDLPYITITDMQSLEDAYLYLIQDTEGQGFDTVCLDSISEIGEVILSAEKKRNKDPRQAYGAMQDQMADLVRAFRDLPGRHVYISAKLEKNKDDQSRIYYGPAMPGQKTGPALPYYFDEVFALRVEKNEDGQTVRALQCAPDGLWSAKDRSGRLDAYEAPDLGAIITKIMHVEEN